MPALAFGLKGSKPSLAAAKPAQKRKAVFGDAGSDDDEDSPRPPPQAGAKKSSRPLKPLQPLKDDTSSSDEDNGTNPRSAKSPKLTHPPSTSYGLQPKNPTANTDKDKYTNLSSLRSAQLHADATAKLDASVYDYDGLYDTFHAAPRAKESGTKEATAPKYMTSLLASTTQRKRDHERAREKAVQRERENEGEEFKDKESFVTGAYKRQQEEMRVAEAEEERRAQEEEERRRKGEGMMGFRKMMLEKEEERMRAIQEAEERRKREGQDGQVKADETTEANGEDDADKKARNLNDHGARIALNEEGEVIDKRQLLTAGLNVAPKKPSSSAPSTANKAAAADRLHSTGPSAAGGDGGRAAQRERQTRMVERQLEAAQAAQAEAEEKEERERAEKLKSRIGEEAKMSAKERYLARKREREAEAAAAAKNKAAG